MARVITPTPDLSIRVMGAVNYANDDFTLSVGKGDLVVPDHIRLAVGDWVGIIPMPGGVRWWVLGKPNDNVVSDFYSARVGFNGDKNGADFVGVRVDVPSGDDSALGDVTIQGRHVNIIASATTVNIEGGLTLPNDSVGNPALAGYPWNTADLASNSIHKVLYDRVQSTDIWSNAALSSGDNVLTGWSVDPTVVVDSDCLFLMFMLNANAQISNPSAASWHGWSVFRNGSVAVRYPPSYVPVSTSHGVSGTTIYYVPPATGSQTFGIRFYAQAAITSGAYLRCASNPIIEFLRFTIIEVRR
jgi:hypothetical protein